MDSFEDLADFYDVDYPDTSDHVFLTRLISALDPRHLLEIPCGSGRNIGPVLEATSREVTFADIAEGMVDHARRRIPKAARDRARVVVGDIRSCHELGTFDLIICPREAFQLLDRPAAAQALDSMATCISGVGLVVVDLFHFSREKAVASDAPPDYFLPDQRDEWVVDWTRTATDRDLAVTRHRRQLLLDDSVHFEMRYELQDSPEAEPRTAQVAFDMANYSRDEFSLLAENSGLDVLTTFAGYTGATESLRTVFVLGSQRSQEAREHLERIRHDVTADQRAPESHGPDAR